jgi:hypothetical protein
MSLRISVNLFSFTAERTLRATWSVLYIQGRTLAVLKGRVLRRIFQPKRG